MTKCEILLSLLFIVPEESRGEMLVFNTVPDGLKIKTSNQVLTMQATVGESSDLDLSDLFLY